jgi:chloride channel 7
VDEPPFSPGPPVLYGLVLRAHLLVLLKKREFLAAPQRCHKEYVAGRFQAEDFDKRGSGKQDTIADVVLSPEEMEMYVDLHPFTNTSPYTVVETMSLAKALVLFREVGLRHLLVVPKACDVSAIQLVPSKISLHFSIYIMCMYIFAEVAGGRHLDEA